MRNLILLSDSYKVSQWKQLPPDATGVYSYFESRGGMFPETTFFGLQYLLKEYLTAGVYESDIYEAESFLSQHIGSSFNAEGWRHIVRDHDGKLPLRIKAVPEGTTVKNHNVLMTVESTCQRCGWLTNYMETLLVQTWYPTTVCTLSRNIKQRLAGWMRKTAGTTEGLEFKLHDFGFRGVSSVESAGLGGLAHLVNFRGTDTMEALVFGSDYYGERCAGFSIPASEHSTITAWGRDGETQAYDNMLTQFPDGLVACVSDSYDIFNACQRIWGGTLRDKVMSRKGTLVIRPDSGYPPDICEKVIEIFGYQFGFSTNQEGFKVLPPQVRVIQGDGVDLGMINLVCERLAAKGWSIENINFGMGGALLQKLHRDTQRFAFKCSAIERGGEWLPVSKDPVTDPGKRSKSGRMKLVYANGTYTTHTEDSPFDDELATIFLDGELLVDDTLSTIRQRAEFL